MGVRAMLTLTCYLKCDLKVDVEFLSVYIFLCKAEVAESVTAPEIP